VLGSLKLEHLALHVVVLSDLVQVYLVFLAVVDSHSDTFAAKAARTPNPMDVGLRVAASLTIGQVQNWHVKVDDDFNFGNVDAPRKHICSDDYVYF